MEDDQIDFTPTPPALEGRENTEESLGCAVIIFSLVGLFVGFLYVLMWF